MLKVAILTVLPTMEYPDLSSTSLFVFQTDPKRLKKDLPKILKTLKPEDRVMIVGTSKSPFDILLILQQ